MSNVVRVRHEEYDARSGRRIKTVLQTRSVSIRVVMGINTLEFGPWEDEYVLSDHALIVGMQNTRL